jgi:hypothetical protein
VELNAADFMSPQNIVSKASVGFRKKILNNKVFAIGVYVGMEAILLPQNATNISLSKYQLIYEGRQYSLADCTALRPR